MLRAFSLLSEWELWLCANTLFGADAPDSAFTRTLFTFLILNNRCQYLKASSAISLLEVIRKRAL